MKILKQIKWPIARITHFYLVLFLVHTVNLKAQNKENDLNNALANGIALGIPGISVAIGKGDSIVWQGQAGYSNIATKTPVKKNSQFGIGSITKTFVATVILQLAEENKLDLNKPASEYLDSKTTYGIPNIKKATLRQLLNHQSGIPTWEFQKDWIRKGRGSEIDLNHIWDKEETLDYIKNSSPDFEPGEKYAYSNTNYTLLGLVIEAVCKNDLMKEIRKRIFEPMDITHTFLESFEETGKDFAHHYHYTSPQFEKNAGIHKEFKEIRPYLIETTAANLSPEWAAGGMASTAADLVKWAQAMIKGKALNAKMQKEFFNHYAPQKTESPVLKYMQGIYKLENYYDGKTVVGHSGGTLGFSANMFWLENTDIVIVSLTNVGNMHSELKQSPTSIFYWKILFPAVLEYFNKN